MLQQKEIICKKSAQKIKIDDSQDFFRSRDYEKSVKSMIQASYTPVIREVLSQILLLYSLVIHLDRW